MPPSTKNLDQHNNWYQKRGAETTEPKTLHWFNGKSKKADTDSSISGWHCYVVTKH